MYHEPKKLERPKSPNRPDKIEKMSYQISTVGENGEEMIEECATYHDGFQVYHSSAYKKKMKRLEKLKNQCKNPELLSANKTISTRFVLTKCKPEQEPDKLEFYLLENFEEINEVHVRKNHMSHGHYSTFVFIAYSENELNI